MVQKNEVLTREDNGISLISRTGTATQKDYLTITETEIPANTIKQARTFDVVDKTRAGRTTPRLMNTLAKVVHWLNHLGSGKIDESHLESRHNIYHNVKINDIRF
jgi:hypothetical protein